MSHGLTLGCLICATLWLQKKPYFVVGREFYSMFLAFVLELATTWSFSTVPTAEKLLNAFSHTLNVKHVQVCCTYNTTTYYIATAVYTLNNLCFASWVVGQVKSASFVFQIHHSGQVDHTQKGRNQLTTQYLNDESNFYFKV